MATKEPRSFKLTTTLNVSSMSVQQQAMVAERLDSAVYEASSGYPTVSQYFVKHIPEDSEIVIGLKIDKVISEKVEAIANSLLDESIDEAFNGGSGDHPVAEESLLVLA